MKQNTFEAKSGKLIEGGFDILVVVLSLNRYVFLVDSRVNIS